MRSVYRFPVVRMIILVFTFLFLFSCKTSDEQKEKAVIEEPVKQAGQVNEKWVDENGDPLLLDGDIIFQTSGSGQSKAIQLATRSKYSHVGMILRLDDKYYVYEAVQPVSVTPIEQFIARGDKKHFVVKRIRETGNILRPDVVEKLKTDGMKYKGKDYDLYFSWTDDKLYCSELVYKLYKEYAGVELGKLQKLGTFDLSSPIVRTKLKERYGNDIPLDENVISPAAIFEDPMLFMVMEQ